MAAQEIIPSRTALLVLDYQVMHAKVDPRYDALMRHAGAVVKAARSKGITIAHCRVAFTPSELAAIPDTNPVFSRLKHDAARGEKVDVDSPESAFHSAVAPEDGDLVFRKHRVGPFLKAPQDTHAIFQAQGIDTLLVGGVSTGGAVAATVVQAADLDYRLFVLEDLCADPSQETHEFLMKFFAKRGTVLNSEQFETLVTSSH